MLFYTVCNHNKRRGIHMPGNESSRFRSKHERIEYLRNLLNSGREFTAAQLADELETDKRTVLRYLTNEVPHLLKIGLVSEKQGTSIIYRAPEGKRTINVTFGLRDALALKMALEAFQPFEGTGLHGYVQSALKQINSTLDKPSADKYENLKSKLAGHTAFRKIYSKKDDDIEDIIACLMYNNWLKITYNNKTDKVAPYSLVAYKNNLYLIAMREEAKDWGKPTTYAVERIKKCERLSSDKFDYPADYKLSDVFPATGGIFDGTEEGVEIEFSPHLETYIKSISWPRGTKITKTRSGKVLLTSKLNISPETINFIICFGPEARVRKPESLRHEIRELLKKTLINYPPG
jgi:predicted DNA-binding transcriptional regulator YafY